MKRVRGVWDGMTKCEEGKGYMGWMTKCEESEGCMGWDGMTESVRRAKKV